MKTIEEITEETKLLDRLVMLEEQVKIHNQQMEVMNLNFFTLYTELEMLEERVSYLEN